ncbi:MAG: ester cyclase [Anaerolineae bacterium]|nr:ester cyclase [Anaerolineae bacterium]
MGKHVFRVCGLGLLAVILLVGCTSSAKEEMAAMQAQVDQAAGNKQVVQTFLGLFMSGAWDDFGQVIAADCVLHEPGGVDVVGLDAMKALWGVAYAPLKDIGATTIAETSEGEMYTVLVTMQATYDGDYMGQPIAGVPVQFNQAETMRIVDGKIAEWWVVFDRLWMSEQLGFALQPK